MWFCRGVQSAVFYYVTLSPCMEARYKRKRRKQAREERAELEERQPEMAHQPMAFTTNRFWEEEIKAGPGPPKGWKRDSISGGRLKDNNKCKDPQSPGKKARSKSVFANNPGAVTFSEPAPPTAPSSTEPLKSHARSQRPSLDQKQSALDTFKGKIRSSLSPETWNFERYEREDEPLWGLNDAMSRMLDRARPAHHRRSSTPGTAENRSSQSHGRPRADTADSDQYDYYRARNPEVNDLHPPVVSQLPAKRSEVAWMLQPPPSRAVMEGKVRPGAEDMSLRKPLCVIGTTKEEERRKRALAEDDRGMTEQRRMVPGPVSEDFETMSDDASVEVKVPPHIGARYEDSGDGCEEPDTEEGSQMAEEASRRASLPQIDYLKPPTKSTTSLENGHPWQPEQPPLAVIASAKSSSSVHTLTLPATSHKANTRNSSPAPAYLRQHGEKGGLDRRMVEASPEWDYLLELCLPQLPPRTRSSLPSGVWV